MTSLYLVYPNTQGSDLPRIHLELSKQISILSKVTNSNLDLISRSYLDRSELLLSPFSSYQTSEQVKLCFQNKITIVEVSNLYLELGEHLYSVLVTQ